MRRSKYSIGKIRNKKMFFLLVVLGLVIGFATVTTTLKINGFTLIKKNTWDIRWDKDSRVLSEDMPAGTTLPTVSTSVNGTTDDTVSFSANLSLPGDFYEFYIDAVNNGTINGEISSVTTTWKKNGAVIENLPDYLAYTVVYADNEEEPAQGDVLLKGQSRTYRIRLEFKEDATSLASETADYSCEMLITYGQGADTPAVAAAGGPGIDQLQETAQPSPSIVPKETINPIKKTRAAVPNEDGGSLPAGEDVIYIGEEPNNFIYFNCDSLDTQDSEHCELWRVIGTDTDNGDRIKIIRDETIGEFVWNEGGTSSMTNDWANSSLKEYLNTTYYDSLTEVSKKLIPTVKWFNAGGYNVVRLNEDKVWEGDQSEGASAGMLYVNERTKFKTTNNAFKRGNVYAKVGLMYASDYAYASAECANDCTATGGHPCMYTDWWCQGPTSDNDFLGVLDDYGSKTCYESNWLYANMNEWTMTASMYNRYNTCTVYTYRTNPYYFGVEDYSKDSQYCQDPNRERKFKSGHPSLSEHPECIENYHYVLAISAVDTGKMERVPTRDGIATESSYARNVRQVVYLKSKVDLEGEGSRNDPYRIVADASILNSDDVLPSDAEPEEDPTPTNDANIVHMSDNSSCSDSVAPTCELNYVNVLSNGFAFSFNCSDDVEINRITSLFDHDPFNGDYDSRTFDRIGTIKNGTVVNGGKTKTYTGKWTTLSSAPPNRWTCYYFSYGGEDKCGNWVVYHTPTCYQF